MKRVAFILILLLAGCAVKKPTAPPMPKAVVRPLIAPKAIYVPPVPKVTVTWDYAGDMTDIVFNVRCLATNQLACPDYGWPIISTTTNKSLTVPVNLPCACVWFTVTASNTSNHTESEFATR